MTIAETSAIRVVKTSCVRCFEETSASTDSTTVRVSTKVVTVLFCGLVIFCGLREQIFAVQDN